MYVASKTNGQQRRCVRCYFLPLMTCKMRCVLYENRRMNQMAENKDAKVVRQHSSWKYFYRVV